MNSDNLKQKLTGKFIVLDGPDGCGKSTHTKLLVQWLKEQVIEVETYRDPGNTAIGEKIRQILLDPGHSEMETRTELLLYMAARAQLLAEKILPAIQNGKCIVMDRWLSSTCAYQGYAGDFGMDNVKSIAQHCLQREWPDLTIILDIDVNTASTRLKDKLDRLELKGNEYHEKVRQGFLSLAESRNDFIVIDTNESIEFVHEKIVKIISNF